MTEFLNYEYTGAYCQMCFRRACPQINGNSNVL